MHRCLNAIEGVGVFGKLPKAGKARNDGVCGGGFGNEVASTGD